MKYGQPIWKWVLHATQEIGEKPFTAAEIVERVHRKNPAIPTITIRTFVVAMAPEHPSSVHYPSTRRKHGHLVYLGDGKYKLREQTQRRSTPIEQFKVSKELQGSQRSAFLESNSGIIELWVRDNQTAIISGRKNYSWNGKALNSSVAERNLVSREIVLSRIRNGCGLDIETLDRVMAWGGFPPFPLRDETGVLAITREAFRFLDEEDLSKAVLRLMSIRGVGISSASKIIGLFDQNHLAIYDSRVGTAIKTLKLTGNRAIKCPPGRSRPGDACTYEQWASNYQTLIWVMEVMRDFLNEQGYPFSIADVEMALFMMGK